MKVDSNMAKGVVRGGNRLENQHPDLSCPGVNKCLTRENSGGKVSLCCCQDKDFCNTASTNAVALCVLLFSTVFSCIFVYLYWSNLLLRFFLALLINNCLLSFILQKSFSLLTFNQETGLQVKNLLNQSLLNTDGDDKLQNEFLFLMPLHSRIFIFGCICRVWSFFKRRALNDDQSEEKSLRLFWDKNVEPLRMRCLSSTIIVCLSLKPVETGKRTSKSA